jgi:superfamily I DNA/RNA helicase
VKNYRSVPEDAHRGERGDRAQQGSSATTSVSSPHARASGDNVRLCVTLGTPEQEAKYVAGEIRDPRTRSGEAGRHRGALPENLQARLVEEELRIEGIPYRFVGGTQFFEKKEVKDALAYLRIAVHPRDELSAAPHPQLRPSRGIGDVTIARVETHALARGKSFVNAVTHADAISDLSDAAKEGCRKVIKGIEAMRENLESPQLSRAALGYFESVGIRSDLEGAAAGSESVADKQRWANVEHLIKGLDRWEGIDEEERPSLATYLQRLTVRREEEGEAAPGNEVTLSSLHGSKGLEWPVVFLIGINEGILPHLRTIDPKASEAAPTDVDEERRLFYVGVTRARDRLYLSRFTRREMRGKELPTAPSRFLTGLPEDILEKVTRDDAKPLEAEANTSSAAALLSMLKSR